MLSGAKRGLLDGAGEVVDGLIPGEPGLAGQLPLVGGVVRHATAATARLTELLPVPQRPLAEPPPGSGLKPVMGDFGLPIVGHMPELLGDMIGSARRSYELYGPISWTGMVGTKVVSALGPDAIETIATNRDKAFGNAGCYDYLIGPFFDRGVMLMDFEEHRHHRRIMQQAFKRDAARRLPRRDEPARSTAACALAARSGLRALHRDASS